MDKLFPIHSSDREVPNCPKGIPWEVIAPHEEQALNNHSQTLEKLAQRGGLGLIEMYAVLSDKSYREAEREVIFSAKVALERLYKLIGAKTIKCEFDKVDRIISTMKENGWKLDPQDSKAELVFVKEC